jgi:cytochrome P450
MHDPEVFERPDDYIPERYLKGGEIDPTVRDPSAAVFGYGRRNCPGRFFSNDAFFAAIAHVLAVFDIKPGVDGEGNEVEVVPNYVTTGIIQYVSLLLFFLKGLMSHDLIVKVPSPVFVQDSSTLQAG